MSKFLVYIFYFLVIHFNSCILGFRLLSDDVLRKMKNTSINEITSKPKTGNKVLLQIDAKLTGPEWPWVVHIYGWEKPSERRDEPTFVSQEYRCAGTLITTRHVLTAAQCLLTEDSPKNDFSVKMGMSHQYEVTDPLLYNSRSLKGYFVHPNSTGQRNDQANLAILVLYYPAIMSEAVSPIRIWPASRLNDATSTLGYLVGWRQIDRGVYEENYMQLSRFLISSQEECDENNYGNNTSTFCADEIRGETSSIGDSGSGLIVYDAENDSYYLRGVLSVHSLGRNENKFCNFPHHVVFTEVSMFFDWIQNITSVHR